MWSKFYSRKSCLHILLFTFRPCLLTFHRSSKPEIHSESTGMRHGAQATCSCPRLAPWQYLKIGHFPFPNIIFLLSDSTQQMHTSVLTQHVIIWKLFINYDIISTNRTPCFRSPNVRRHCTQKRTIPALAYIHRISVPLSQAFRNRHCGKMAPLQFPRRCSKLHNRTHPHISVFY